MFAFIPLNIEWQFLLLAPIGLCFWSFVLAGIAYFGGWHRLGQLYCHEEVRFAIGDGGPVEKYRRATLKIGAAYFPCNYGNCVTVSLSDEGVGLRVMPTFRPFHPPLLLPWSAIENCQPGKELWFFEVVVFQVAGIAYPIRIYGRAGRAIERARTARLELNDSGTV